MYPRPSVSGPAAAPGGGSTFEELAQNGRGAISFRSGWCRAAAFALQKGGKFCVESLGLRIVSFAPTLHGYGTPQPAFCTAGLTSRGFLNPTAYRWQRRA
ncbi:hypothetical protein SBA4_1360023 [Candidatus Sulfopaludibacter sp. SbA4]|nr:hypothetical protein SBA4_1360023 [Candidatus Sulfopaludibacter sp. SbA4]